MHMYHTRVRMTETYAYKHMIHIYCACVCMKGFSFLSRVTLFFATRGKGRRVEKRCLLPTT